MKASYNWLKEYCKLDLSPEDAARRLTMSGTEVEEIRRVGEDFCFEIEITSNRPDLLAHVGIARELHALTGAPFSLPGAEPPEGGRKTVELARVSVTAPDLCPRYTARVITGVKVGPSPAWLVERLETIGLRSVNNVVDVTNYVLMEIGQPLHAFDLDKLAEKTIIVRRAQHGEEITVIDGSKHRLSSENLVIADASRAVAVAGVMGGLETEVGDDTTNVLLESALFAPLNVRTTSRALGLASDSSYRFERGVDQGITDWASRRAAALILELAGGEVAAEVIDIKGPDFRDTADPVQLRCQRLALLTGMDVPEDEAAAILERLGFGVQSREAGKIVVSVPSFRMNDVYREADLIEEVARIHGLENVPAETNMKLQLARRSKREIVEDIALTVMTSMGYNETITFSLTSSDKDQLISLWTEKPALKVKNPMSHDFVLMRRSLMPGLLTTKKNNEDRGVRRCNIFELSSVYIPRDGGKLPLEKRCLAFLTEGDLLDAKGVIETLAERLGAHNKISFVRGDHHFFEWTDCTRIMSDSNVLGYIGRVSDKVRAKFDLREAPYVGELDFDLLIAESDLERRYARIPAFPPIVRDLAIVVDESVTWAEIEEAITSLKQEFLTGIQFFDIYRGEQIPAGKKSMAFSLTYRSPERTLRNEEADKAIEQVVARLAEKFDAKLR